MVIGHVSMFDCDCCEVMIAQVYEARMTFHLFYVYRRQSIDDDVRDYLLESICKIQYDDI